MIFSAAPAATMESPIPARDCTGDAAIPNPATAYDSDLVRRFNTGDGAAFVEIVTRYRGKMLSVALSTLRNHADAEEVAQDTFVRAYHGLAHFRGESSLASWLGRIAYNLSCNRYWYFFRRYRHTTRSFDYAFGDDGKTPLTDIVVSDNPDPAREAANREFFAHVTACMDKLSAQQREILTLRNLLGHSYQEIAETLGLSLGTVKSRIARARQNLRALLTRTYAEPDAVAGPAFSWFEFRQPSSRLNDAWSRTRER